MKGWETRARGVRKIDNLKSPEGARARQSKRIILAGLSGQNAAR
jgi:hypothetical protein